MKSYCCKKNRIDVGENLEDHNEERGSVSNEKQLD